MALKPSQTNVNKCATVANNPRDPLAGGVFNPACVLPRPATTPIVPGGISPRTCGTFGTSLPVRGGRPDSVGPAKTSGIK